MRNNQPTRIFVHTTDADYNIIPEQFFAVDRWHKERFGNYCLSSMGYYGGYHILISNGKEYRYREDDEESCAVTGHNTSSLSVALAFDGDIQMPKPADVELLKQRLKKWGEKYAIPLDNVEFVSPHRAVAPEKTCFGSLLKDDWAVQLMKDIKKDDEAWQKKIETEKQKQILADTLRDLILRLRILLGNYIEALNKREK